MRWVVVHPGPNFSVADVYEGWTEALAELGEDVVRFNLDDRLAVYSEACIPAEDGTLRRAWPDLGDAVGRALDGLGNVLYRTQPDVLLCVTGAYVDGALLDCARARGTRTVLLATESPYEDDRQLQIAEHFDLILLNDPINAERYAAAGHRVAYVPHAYRPTVHFPPDFDYTGRLLDPVFVGTGYASRVDWFARYAEAGGPPFALAGNWDLPPDSPLAAWHKGEQGECVDNVETALLYRFAGASVNLYRREANAVDLVDGLAMGPREVEMAACGLWFVRERREESDRVLPMLPAADSPEEAASLLRWYLARDDVREAQATAARAAVAERTFARNATALRRLIEG